MKICEIKRLSNQEDNIIMFTIPIEGNQNVEIQIKCEKEKQEKRKKKGEKFHESVFVYSEQNNMYT